jgi:hypothetical protein
MPARQRDFFLPAITRERPKIKNQAAGEIVIQF